MKCGVIAHSAKETRPEKEQWEWRLEVRWRERVGQKLKKGVGNIGGSSYNKGG